MLNVARRGKQKQREGLGEPQNGETTDQPSKRKPRWGGGVGDGDPSKSEECLFIYLRTHPTLLCDVAAWLKGK